MKTMYLILPGLLLFQIACTPPKDKQEVPLRVVDKVDLARYIGEWFEIARYPNLFQKGCDGSKTVYSLRDDGKIAVRNECYDRSFATLLRSVEGKAWVVDVDTNARLKVSFFWPFSGDYWIIDMGSEYQYAVVGHPQRKYLWILARVPNMADELYGAILPRLTEQGYDVSRLIKYDDPEILKQNEVR